MSEHEDNSVRDSSPQEQPSNPTPSPSAGHHGKGKNPSRSRLGCMTCRKRKVKCDEVHPRCGQCARLRLTCHYQTALVAARSKSRKKTSLSYHRPNTASDNTKVQTASAPLPKNNAAPVSFSGPLPSLPFINGDQWSLSAQEGQVGSENQQLESTGRPSSALPDLQTASNSWLSGDTSFPIGEDFWRPDIFGEESFWMHLPIFSHISTGPDPSIFENFPRDNVVSATTLTDGAAPTSVPENSAESVNPATGSWEGGDQNSPLFGKRISLGETQPSPSSVLSFSDIPSHEISLLRHFVDFAVPPILIGVEPRWTSARHTLFKVAKSNPLVRHAICSFSALSLADENDAVPSKNSNQTSAYFYDLALAELQIEIDNLVGGRDNARRHENILASIFFLSYVELTMSSTPKYTLELLRRAHAISRNNESSKSPLGNQLRIWLKLLDAKVVSAGGEGIHLLNNSDLKDFEGPSDGRESPTDSDANADAPITSDAPHVDQELVLFNCINHSAYNFYVQVLDFAGRIAQLDRWHRPRGTVAEELEVMHAAQKIIGDLDELWSRRPAILNLADDEHDQLIQHLSARLAKNVQTHLRTYVANFYACFVHVQRAVYPHLATTPQTSDAVDRIVTLVRLCERDHVKLCASMLWPLMMAGCEAPDAATRDWLVGTVEAMNGRLGNTARTAKLIREICRRQESGHRADARTVMQEIFGTIFAII